MGASFRRDRRKKNVKIGGGSWPVIADNVELANGSKVSPLSFSTWSFVRDVWSSSAVTPPTVTLKTGWHSDPWRLKYSLGRKWLVLNSAVCSRVAGTENVFFASKYEWQTTWSSNSCLLARVHCRCHQGREFASQLRKLAASKNPSHPCRSETNPYPSLRHRWTECPPPKTVWRLGLTYQA